MIKVAVELVHATLAKLANLWVEKNAVCVGADGEELANRRVWRDADRLVVLNGNDR